MARSKRVGSASKASTRNASPGTNMTTRSIDPPTTSSYRRPARVVTWASMALAWSFMRAARAAGSSSAVASMNASSGTLESTTTVRPAGRCTTMSGRATPPSPAKLVCSEKSQCSTMPANSTTRRSCTSPQDPRVRTSRSAVEMRVVWPCRSTAVRWRSPSVVVTAVRSRSIWASFWSSSPSFCDTGSTISFTACSLVARSATAPCWNLPSCCSATCRNCWLFAASASLARRRKRSSAAPPPARPTRSPRTAPTTRASRATTRRVADMTAPDIQGSRQCRGGV